MILVEAFTSRVINYSIKIIMISKAIILIDNIRSIEIINRENKSEEYKILKTS